MLLTACWLTVAVMYFVPFLLLLPLALIPGVGKTMYRRAIGLYDRYGRISIMLIPFSWCMPPLRVRDYDSFRAMKRKGNALLLSTHCSRIDWLIGVYLSCLDEPHEQIRTGFVAEFTTALMPLLGWSRVLFGDILVRRAFHKDRPLIEGNIRSFHQSNVKRLIFLAPEGFIADPGSKIGDQYIPECEEFMVNLGRKPLTHLLTPRYKGMSAFIHHAPDNIGSCAMAFVDYPEVDESTGRLTAGSLCSRQLRDPKRVIPDLHSVFRGGLGVFIAIHPMVIDEADRGDPKKIKAMLIEDQIRKDHELRTFEETGAFPAPPGSTTTTIHCPHVKFHLITLAHAILSLIVWTAAAGISFQQAIGRILGTILFIFLAHSASHNVVRWATGDISRESLVGETAIKAVLSAISVVARAVLRASTRLQGALALHGSLGADKKAKAALKENHVHAETKTD